MSKSIITLQVRPPAEAPRAAAWIGRWAAALWLALAQPRNRERDLLQLAGEVEKEQPNLAMELRGIAMHEASAAGVRRC